MIDTREIFPVGTFIGKNNEERISLYTYANGEGGRIPATLALKRGCRQLVGIPDITKDQPYDVMEELYSPQMLDKQDENHEINKLRVLSKEQPKADTVFIVAPGRVDNKTATAILQTDAPVVTVSRANERFPMSDYTVVSCWADVKKYNHVCHTTAVLSTNCSPSVAALNWKDITWYTHKPKKIDGIPSCYPTEGVVTDALWFAIERLGAKKVVLCGVEQPVTSSNYFWEGILLQAHCYWYSKSGIEIWNCTPATSVVAGVILGTLEEACQ